MPKSLDATLLLCCALAAAPVSRAAAQELGWAFKSEFSFVATDGNSESLTLGLGATLRRSWENTVFRIEASSVRTESGTTTRRAIGTAGDFRVESETDRETTAEVFNVRGRLDRNVSETFFVFGGTDWLRNTFAGLESRILIAVGAGNTWIEDEETRFKTDVAGTVTFQDDVVQDPFVERNFPGLRAGYELWRKISDSAEGQSELVVDWNLNETGDFRFDWTNSLSVSVVDAVALKPSLQLLWRNRPSLTEVPLFTPGGVDTGEVVTVPLDELDTFFRLALVVTL